MPTVTPADAKADMASPPLAAAARTAPAADGAPAPEAVGARPHRAPRSWRAFRACLTLLALAALLWLLAKVLLAVALLAGALLAALLLTALLEPAARGLRRLGTPPALAAAAVTFVLVGSIMLITAFVYSRSASQVADLQVALTQAVDEVRSWLVDGPLALDPAQVQELRNLAVARLEQALPSALGGAMTALRLLGAAAIAVFAVFFLLKDGASMWRWVLSWAPQRTRARVEVGGAAAWQALTSYVRGMVVVAAVDAVGIGAALLILGVPVWPSLTLLTFLGAFVPLIGATAAGAAAVLVTLASEGARDAIIMLIVVLVVQQLEGNLLQPLIMGRAVRLHPLAILCAVTAGMLLLGVVGALVAVPLVAVAYRVLVAIRPAGGRSAAGAASSP